MGLQELEALPTDVKEGGGAWKLCRMETAPGVGLRAGEGCWEEGGRWGLVWVGRGVQVPCCPGNMDVCLEHRGSFS